MSKLESFRMFLNERLMAAAVEIFQAVEKTVMEYQEDNRRLRRLLRITPDINLCRIDSLHLFLSGSEEGIPPEHQTCGMKDQEPRQIKEEAEELETSRVEKQQQEFYDTKHSIYTPPCVKSESDPEDEPTPTEYPTIRKSNTYKLPSFRVFLNKCLTVSAAVDIFSAVEKTLDENKEKNDRQQRRLLTPSELNLHRPGSLQVSLSVSEEEVPPEHQRLQEWSPRLGKEEPETTQIKQEQEQLGTSQEEEPLQGMSDTKNNRDKASSRISVVISDPVVLDFSPLSDSSSSWKDHCSKPSTPSRKPHRCLDCGEYFSMKSNLRRHVALNKKRPSECNFCKERFNSTCKLKSHVRLCQGGKLYTCPICGTTFKLKVYLSRHMTTHTGAKPFSCSDCDKRFSRKEHLMRHKLTHMGGKSFSCGDCGKSFNRKEHLLRHKLTHTGEKLFSCGDCGKGFTRKSHLIMHKQIHIGGKVGKGFGCVDCGKSFSIKSILISHQVTHTGERPFICGDCGKSFNLKKSLTSHKLNHTDKKPFSCDECGKSFNRKGSLNSHKLTHTGERPFSCCDCGKSFNRKGSLTTHKLRLTN